MKFASVIIVLAQLVAFVFSERIMDYSETLTYNDKIIYAASSPYQRIVVTKNKRELRLFLNGNLQFSSADEYRYHEALVHPVMASIKKPEYILVLGGGDGIAAREILKYPSVKKITLVDLDAAMTKLFSVNKLLLDINQSSLLNKKVQIINADAFQWMRDNQQQFDAIIIDFPDPSNFSVGKLYTNTFYKLVYAALKDKGEAVVQSTSPYVAPKSYWCINKTLQSVGFYTIPYHNYVPSFGEWGYTIARKDSGYTVPPQFINGLRYVNYETVKQMMVFPSDMLATSDLLVNKLNNQELVQYFETEWNNYLHQ